MSARPDLPDRPATYAGKVRTVDAGPDTFGRALEQVRRAQIRPEFDLDEAPAPARLAPSALALVAESAPDMDLGASGRFVLLHDPDGVDEWQGEFRCVIFVRMNMDPEVGGDPLVHQVAWSWLVDALTATPTVPGSLGGTVTCLTGTSFGSLADRPTDTIVEVRASWTPAATPDLPAEGAMATHVEAWGELLALGAGLPPVIPGVADVAARRRQRQ